MPPAVLFRREPPRPPRLARQIAACALGLLLCAGASGAAAAPHHRHPHIDRSGRPQSGRASFYGVRGAGKTTASGTKLAPNRMTAASRTLPLGTKAKVTNVATGKSVNVTVTDRGPFAKNRILDVTPKAAHKLGMKTDGVSPVNVQPLHEPPPPARTAPAG